MRVCDTGTAVPANVERTLFHEPVERGTGLGIGLFNTARLARQAGYALELTSNKDGSVCFALRREAPSTGGEA
jgi:sensor histidine kinase regulating citrate/malate metabolism